MIPLKDENPTSTFPLVTLVLIAACVFVYFFVQPRGQGDLVSSQVEETEFTYERAAIPKEVLQGEPLSCGDLAEGDGVRCAPGVDPAEVPFPEKNVYVSVLLSMFLHGGLLHIAGNMLFLWVFGNNIEDRMGKLWYVAFYVGGGIAATVAHFAVDADSTIPVVGASGAIAAVMGAYLVLFPNAPIKTLFVYIIILFRDISAKWLLGFWFVSQFFIGSDSGVAWAAHVGGFVFGAVVALAFRARLRPPPRPYRDVGWAY